MNEEMKRWLLAAVKENGGDLHIKRLQSESKDELVLRVVRLEEEYVKLLAELDKPERPTPEE